MKLIIHAGMGKTGTSAIQAALGASERALLRLGAQYLGMWLRDIDPAYVGYDGFERFCAQSDAELRRDARRLIRTLDERPPETFIYSNESVFGSIAAFHPFIDELVERGVDVRVVIYLRPMPDWLPSAFVQWNAFHKTHRGPIQSFAEKGRALSGLYALVPRWLDALGDRVLVRPFGKGRDVVDDFEEVIGLPLSRPEKRVWERIDPAETVLRGLFNDRIDDPAVPAMFERSLRLARDQKVRSVDAFREKVLDTSGLDAILTLRRPIIDEIMTRTGIDVGRSDRSAAEPPGDEQVRREIQDYLVEIVIQQSFRLNELERRLREMTAERKG